MTGQEHLNKLGKEHEKALERLEGLKTYLLEIGRVASLHEPVKTFEEMLVLLDHEVRMHFRKEEEGLFPAMESFLPADSGPLYVMNLEHEAIRQTFTRLKNVVKNIQIPEANAEKLKAVLMETGFHFISLMRNHIQKEDHVLFPMAEDHLTQRVWEQLEKKCETIEKEDWREPEGNA